MKKEEGGVGCKEEEEKTNTRAKSDTTTGERGCVCRVDTRERDREGW